MPNIQKRNKQFLSQRNFKALGLLPSVFFRSYTCKNRANPENCMTLTLTLTLILPKQATGTDNEQFRSHCQFVSLSTKRPVTIFLPKGKQVDDSINLHVLSVLIFWSRWYIFTKFGTYVMPLATTWILCFFLQLTKKVQRKHEVVRCKEHCNDLI